MKALNEAYRILHDENARRDYDRQRRGPIRREAPTYVAPTAREVGFSGLALNAGLCVIFGLLLLFLVHFNGLWFLWPLLILAAGVIAFGIYMGHAAIAQARESLTESHPLRRFRVVQEIVFWSLIAGGGYGVYLIWTF